VGADVIQVEPPEGSSARHVGPWRNGNPGPERSLFFAAYARNKRSLVLDLDDGADLAHLRRLVAGADFLIESNCPGHMARWGLGYPDLRAIQPGLIYVSITPFGQTGPKADWRGSDLTQMAAGGFAYLTGESEGPPTRICVPQAHAHAGADAAIGALIAHFERRRTGRGQHVDVSIQQSVTLGNMYRTLDAAVGMAPAQRLAEGIQAGGVLLPTRHRTRDGWVTLGPMLIPSTGHFMKRLLAWLAEEGFCDASWLEEDWGSYGVRLGSGRLPADAYDPVKRTLDAFFATKSCEELMRAAVERKLLLAPVLELSQIIESEQLASRGFPVAVGREGAPGDRHPGPFAKCSAAPLRYRLPAPRLDEHGTALRNEPTRRPAPAGDEPPGELPLAGVKILDLFWVIAGPAATRMLADYGATVVRVESAKRLDTLRLSPPWQFAHPHPEGAAGFQSANANKLGITLDLDSQAGRAVALDLVRWADVVTESFAPGVMDAWKLGWDDLRAVNPALIMLSSCIMGQTGPWRGFAGFGRLAASLAGSVPLAGPATAPDPSALHRRDRVALQRRRDPGGARASRAHRQGAVHRPLPDGSSAPFPGTGLPRLDRERPDPGADRERGCRSSRPRNLPGRRRRPLARHRRSRRGPAACALPRDRSPRPRRSSRSKRGNQRRASGLGPVRETGAAAELLRADIPAHPALDTPGLFADPQLQHRRHFIAIGSDLYPSTTIESSRLHLSRTPARDPERALSLGRDNDFVLETILGYPRERVVELAKNEVLR
jgi:crotonobetainyl-CoA:carnitine CoA-transferase CaiB-like acyl-CoA transferase